MDTGTALEFVQHTLVLTLLICGPMLLIGMVVGVLISIVQAVTQIQEQTLTFVPKIAAMIAAAVVLMPWIVERLLDYSIAMFGTGQLP